MLLSNCLSLAVLTFKLHQIQTIFKRKWQTYGVLSLGEIINDRVKF